MSISNWGARAALKAITGWPFAKAGGRGKEKSLTPEHRPTSSKETPQPQAINRIPETPRSTSMHTDLLAEAPGAGLAQVLSAASNNCPGKGLLSTKGTELYQAQKLWKDCLSTSSTSFRAGRNK